MQVFFPFFKKTFSILFRVMCTRVCFSTYLSKNACLFEEPNSKIKVKCSIEERPLFEDLLNSKRNVNAYVYLLDLVVKSY